MFQGELVWSWKSNFSHFCTSYKNSSEALCFAISRNAPVLRENKIVKIFWSYNLRFLLFFDFETPRKTQYWEKGKIIILSSEYSETLSSGLVWSVVASTSSNSIALSTISLNTISFSEKFSVFNAIAKFSKTEWQASDNTEQTFIILRRFRIGNQQPCLVLTDLKWS